jgi:hypothetical protein
MISFSFEVTSKQLYQAAHRESSFYNVAWEYYQGNRHSGSRSATDVDGMQIRAGRRTMVKWESLGYGDLLLVWRDVRLERIQEM